MRGHVSSCLGNCVDEDATVECWRPGITTMHVSISIINGDWSRVVATCFDTPKQMCNLNKYTRYRVSATSYYQMAVRAIRTRAAFPV